MLNFVMADILRVGSRLHTLTCPAGDHFVGLPLFGLCVGFFGLRVDGTHVQQVMTF